VNSAEAERVERFEILAKLMDLSNRGVTLSQRYTIDSDIDTMRREFKVHYGIRNKQVVVSIYEQAFFTGINIFQFVNETYNPFNFKLKNFSTEVRSEIDLYRDIFADFYELYHKDGGRVHPMIRLGLALGNTMVGHHIKNSREEDEAAERERQKKYIDEQVAATIKAAGIVAAPAGQPSYEELRRANENQARQLAYQNATMGNMMEQIGGFEKQLQNLTSMSGQVRGSNQQQPMHSGQAQHQQMGTAPQRAPSTPLSRPMQAPGQWQGNQPPQQSQYGQPQQQQSQQWQGNQPQQQSQQWQGGGAQYSMRPSQNQEQNRLNDYTMRLAMDERMQRHRVQMQEQDKFMTPQNPFSAFGMNQSAGGRHGSSKRNTSSRNRGRSDGSDDDDSDSSSSSDSDSDEEDHRGKGNSQRHGSSSGRRSRVSSGSSSSSSSSSSSGSKHSAKGSSRGGSREKRGRLFTIDTEKVR
jgi:hypothetical protein